MIWLQLRHSTTSAVVINSGNSVHADQTSMIDGEGMKVLVDEVVADSKAYHADCAFE
jgi:hypothetical protein